MQAHPKISASQLLSLIISSTLALGIFSFPRETIQAGGSSAGYGLVLAWAVAAVIALAIVRWGQLFPGLSAVGSFQIVAGPLGTVFAHAQILYSAFFSSFVVKNFTELLKSVFYPQTPEALLIALILGIAVYQASRGLQGLARSVQIVIPFALFMMVVIYLIGLSRIHPTYLVTHPPALAQTVRAAYMTFYVFLAAPALLMVNPMVREPRLAPRTLAVAALIILAVLLLVFFDSVGIFGRLGILRILYPTVSVLRIIRVEGFLIERLGLFMVIGGAFLVFSNVSISLWAAGTAFVEVTGLSEKAMPWVLLALGVIAAGAALPPYGTNDLFRAIPIIIVVGGLMAYVLPVAFFLVAWIRGLGLGRRNGPFGKGRSAPPKGIKLWSPAVTQPGPEAELFIGKKAVERWRRRLEAGR
ncbi:MAG TPA: GerAB/ArcD/ProY family transporter [Bacillota bacterium]